MERESAVRGENRDRRAILSARGVIWLGIVLLVVSPTSRAQETFIAYQVPAGVEGNHEFDGALGLDFVVNAAIVINRLGVFDSGTDGLERPITARIFDRSTEVEVARVEFTPEEPGDPVGGSRFKPLAEPLSLPAGFAGTVSASGYGASEPAGSQAAAAFEGVSTDDGPCSLTFVGGGRSGDPETPDAFPANPEVGPFYRYLAGTFEFQPVEIPEPTGGVAYAVPEGTPGNQAFTGSLGLDFDVERTIEITRLGVFDSESDGLELPLTVRVFARSSRIELARLDFSSDDPGDLLGGSRFKALDPPLLLPAGTRATVVAFGYGLMEPSGNQSVESMPLELQSGGCAIRFVGSRFGEASDPELFPVNAPRVPDLFVAGTFEFRLSDTVPEAPLPPTGLSAEPGDGSVELTWNPPAEGPPVEGYNVYLLVADSAIRRNLLPIASSTFTVPKLVNGVESCFVVRSVGLGAVESEDSSSACVRPTSGRRPESTFVAYEVPRGTVGNQSFGGALGMHFTVNSDIIVTRLGVFDSGSDGLATPLVARLYARRPAIELVRAAFTPSEPGELVGGSRFKDLPAPLELPAGFEGTIVASGYGSGEMNGNQNAGRLDLSTDSGGCAISFGGAAFGEAGSWPATFDSNLAPHHYAAGTFEYGLAPGVRPSIAGEGIAYVVPEGTEGNQIFEGSLGMDFVVNDSIVVTELGVFDDLSDGLRRSLTARLFDRETREAVATLEFAPTDPGDLVGGSRFKLLDPPVVLPAGFQGAIVAEGYGEEERSGNRRVSDLSLSTNDGGCLLSFVGGGRLGLSTPGAFPPTPAGGPANIYAAGTFRFEANVVHQVAGDCDQSGARGFGDISCMIEALFPGFVIVPSRRGLPCGADSGNLAVMDLNGDGVLDLADVLHLSTYLFRGGPPPAPGTGCFSLSTSSGCPPNARCR